MVKEYFKTVAEDLQNLEINTIIKSDMSAIKMPACRRLALYDLAEQYSKKLQGLNIPRRIYWKYAGIRSFEELKDCSKIGLDKCIRELKIAEKPDRKDIYKKISILERIYYQSSQIEEIFKDLKRNVKKENSNKKGYLDSPDYIFGWDNIPGNDSERLLRLLKDDLDIDWVENASISKSDDKKTISISKGNHSAKIIINESKEKATLIISKEKTYNLRIRNENEVKFADPHLESMFWNNDINKEKMSEIDDLKLSSGQIVMIRKAWEIGTEQIVLQTVIQLDGDVTTRISKDLITRPNNEIIFQIHNKSISTSTAFWANLVKVFGEIAGKSIKLFFGK